ncbi:hypothetical protein [Micromonospora sp. NPDC001898]|uniref:hypothetical protein n=1 Tax=Micromonospora sp. NPDC001898 TaxID=3364221 RepID=UPI00367AEFA2
MERWLRHWLDNRTRIRPTTRFHYTRDVDNILIPHLGHYRIADLDARLLRTVFAQIAVTTNSKGRPVSGCSTYESSSPPRTLATSQQARAETDGQDQSRAGPAGIARGRR